MAKNEYGIGRTAYGSFTMANAATTHSTGCMVPAGAVVTGISLIAPSAVTTTNTSATLHVKVGSQALAATFNGSDLPAVTAIGTTAVAAPYVSADGELVVLEGATGTSAATATYEIYVDYLYVV